MNVGQSSSVPHLSKRRLEASRRLYKEQIAIGIRRRWNGTHQTIAFNRTRRSDRHTGFAVLRTAPEIPQTQPRHHQIHHLGLHQQRSYLRAKNLVDPTYLTHPIHNISGHPPHIGHRYRITVSIRRCCCPRWWTSLLETVSMKYRRVAQWSDLPKWMDLVPTVHHSRRLASPLSPCPSCKSVGQVARPDD